MEIDKFREKFFNLYKFVSENLILGKDDLELGGQDYNSLLLFSMLTKLVGGKELIFGEPGFGKTTTSEIIISLSSGLPLDIVLASELHGNPEITKESIVGIPDLVKLNMGKRGTLWSKFVLIPDKIVDEINRMPGGKQDLLLEGIDRGNFSYNGLTLFIPPGSLYATANYNDIGNTELILPLRDRFDLGVVAKDIGALGRRLIRVTDNQHLLKDKAVSRELARLLDSEITSNKDYEKFYNDLKSISTTFKADLEKRLGVELFSDKELEEFRKTVPKDLETEDTEKLNLFLDRLVSEINFCARGEKRDAICSDCHYKPYYCSKIENKISIRFSKTFWSYFNALTLLFPEHDAIHDTTRKVLPYLLWHRLNFKDDILNKAKMLYKTNPEPVELYAAKNMVNDIINNFDEDYLQQFNYLKLLAEGKRSEAEQIKGQHPVYLDYLSS